MSCHKHFLFLNWTRHSWHRRVTGDEDFTTPDTDMWGRVGTRAYTCCHTEYVCANCGATKSEALCECDKAQAETCKVRLEWVNRSPAAKPVSAEHR